jgi:heme-degrading monooxygenase HmoA
MEDPMIADFANNLDRVNALAERMDGFIWRHVEDPVNATDAMIDDDPNVIYNCSVWASAEALERFVWGTLHARFYERRAEWFRALGSMHFAMWWVPQGYQPTPEDSMAKLAYLDAHGPSDVAFGWAELPGATLWKAHHKEPQVAT